MIAYYNYVIAFVFCFVLSLIIFLASTKPGQALLLDMKLQNEMYCVQEHFEDKLRMCL